VAVSVELPEAERFRGSPLTLDEARRLLSVTAGDRLSPLWWVAIDTGLRIGELLALGWDHVDLEAGTLRVEGQLQRRDGRWERTPPKAARSLDVVSLSAETVAALRRHRLEQASERLPSTPYFGLVFRTRSGMPYHQSEILKAFKAACRRAGIAERRVHDLRHSSQTIMRELGVPEDVRMARAGHSTPAMSRDYGQARTGIDRAAAELLGKALAG
jgi:integrase